MLKRTPLFAAHQKLGGKLIEFGGWEMPVQYTSIMDEHQAVRTAAGLFDISHMGEVIVSGPAALPFLNRLLTNDARKLTVGLGQYTLMCNERGGVIDDLYAYRLAEQTYLLIINAGRIDVDVPWLQEQFDLVPSGEHTTLQHVSEITAAIAVQGPRVVEFIDTIFAGPAIGGAPVTKPGELKKNQVAGFDFSGTQVWVGRTGYTGEDGFEVIAPSGIVEAIWNRTLEAGQSFGLKPAGLGARDTLRTEACFPLYGHELDENTTPIEAGVGFFVALDKGEFIGRAPLADQKANGVNKKAAAFKMSGRSAPPRPHYAIWSAGPEGRKIGDVVSGTQSPTLGCGIGIGYVPPEFAAVGTKIEIEIRGNRIPAEIAAKPLYRKAS
ncbi:MAG: glycine cleavage system aminomethyltransferase GcvT [Opitutaceae bacterium]|nr:glycine cleavage system aminomethyltransferase GcvT [Verrucomicrobiales bacterium]